MGAVVSRGTKQQLPVGTLRVQDVCACGCKRNPLFPVLEFSSAEQAGTIRPPRVTSHLSQALQFLHVTLDISPLIYAELKYIFFPKKTDLKTSGNEKTNISPDNLFY